MQSIPGLLDRCAVLLRRGQHAYACLTWQVFVEHPQRRDTAGFAEISDALARGDYLRMADVVEYVIAPIYAEAVNVSTA